MTRHFLTRDRISDFKNFDEHAMELISLMKRRLTEGHPVDFQVRVSLFGNFLVNAHPLAFQDAIGRFTLDSATVHLYGKDVRSLEAGLPYPPYDISGKRNPDTYESHPSNLFV